MTTTIDPKGVFPHALSAAGDVAYDWDLCGDKIAWLGAWQKLFGAGAQRAPESSAAFLNCVFATDRHVAAEMAPAHAEIDREYRLAPADGPIIWVHERGTLEFSGGKPARRRGILRIIEASKMREEALHVRAETDPLTGCFNRAHFGSIVGAAVARVHADKSSAAYLVVGIDNMSFVNDAVGTESADALLRGVAARIADLIPEAAVMGRTGGDMFGILVTEHVGREYYPLVERILQSFRDYPIETPVAPIHISVSLGGVQFPSAARTGCEVMIRAEQALREAQRRGRNAFVEYHESESRTQSNRQILEIGERVKRALKQDGLRLAFQPIIESATGQVVFYEALVRMFSDDGQPIPAAHFIPVVEQLGLAHQLDRKVLELAVKELEAAEDLKLSINISGLTAAQTDWPQHIQHVLGRRPAIARRLIIEITETAAITDVSETKRFAETFRAIGGQVALDDFGAGYTSIRHLRSLPVAIMKLDRDFLADITTNAEQQHVVRMLLGVARALGLRCVAEGVETEEVAAWLRRERVDMMQGYYFGKPSLERVWIAKAGDKAPAPVTNHQKAEIRAR